MSSLATTAAELRREFDGAFARPPPERDADAVELLGIQIGAEPYALRLSEIAGLFAGKHVTPVPSRAAALLGIAGFRGAIVPVYDLRLLLGIAASASPRWMVMAAAKPVAFAFDAAGGHLRVRREAIASNRDARHDHLVEIARVPEPRPIVRLASILDDIERAARNSRAPREP